MRWRATAPVKHEVSLPFERLRRPAAMHVMAHGQGAQGWMQSERMGRTRSVYRNSMLEGGGSLPASARGFARTILVTPKEAVMYYFFSFYKPLAADNPYLAGLILTGAGAGGGLALPNVYRSRSRR